MRNLEKLNSPEFNDDMTDLVKELEKANIPFTYQRYAGAEKGVKELIGYYPTGEWHIMIGDDSDKISVIRGMVSFGNYECCGGKYKDVTRFASAKELIEDYLK